MGAKNTNESKYERRAVKPNYALLKPGLGELLSKDAKKFAVFPYVLGTALRGQQPILILGCC